MIHTGENTATSANDASQLDSYIEKNETRSLSPALHRIQLKMNQGSQHKTRYPEPGRGESKKCPWTYRPRKGLSEQDPDSMDIKVNNFQSKAFSMNGNENRNDIVSNGNNLYLLMGYIGNSHENS